MQFFALARKFGVSSKSKLLSFFGAAELPVTVHCEQHLSGTVAVFSESDLFSATQICRLTDAGGAKGVICEQDLAMVIAVSAGIAVHPKPWRCSGLNFGDSTVRRCMTAPMIGISGFSHRGECYYVATTRRRRQLCRVSSLAVQASSELGQSEEGKVDPKGLKTTIHDSLETERITVELFPELDFTIEGNYYPKLVKLVARKINLFLKEGGEERVPDLLSHLGMKLSPHIVAEVMKLQSNVSTADRFFDWAGNQPDFVHNSHTYNLKFWNLVNNKHGVPGSNLVLALIVLEEMVAKGLSPESLGCNILIDRLCKDNKVGAALKLTRVLERDGYPDIYTYNSLINGLGKAGLVKDVCDLFDEMKQRKCVPDVVTYNTVIKGLCKGGLFKEAFGLLDEMRQSGRTPDRVTYNSIMYGLCNGGRWQEALSIFDDLPGKEIVPDVVTYNSLLVGLFKCGQLDEARKVYDLMGLRGCQPDRITFNILIDGFLNSSQVDEAWKLFHYMEEEGFSPDEVTYNTLIGGLVENYRLTEALRVFEVMKEKGCMPNAITYRLLGLPAEKKLDNVAKEDSARERESGSNGFGESKMMEDEMQFLHN